MQFTARHAIYLVSAVLVLAAAVAGVYLWTNNEPPEPDTAESTDSGPEFPAQYDRLGVTLGDPSAPVVVREFIDYQCPACKRFSPVIKKLIHDSSLVDEGRVRIVFFDFPLDVHDNAMPAARAARCGARQDAFLAMHDGLFAHQEEWSEQQDPIPAFRDIAVEYGVDEEKLEQCLRQNKTLEAVQRSLQLSRQLGIRSTPTVLINNKVYSGGPSYETFKARVKQALEED